MSPEPAAWFLLATFVLIGGMITLVLRGPLGRALGRRIEGKYADPGESLRVVELEQRVADLETVPARVGELEERLDFAERLLAQAREPERLDAGRNVP